MSCDLGEIRDYIMATREELFSAEGIVAGLEARVVELEARLYDHEQTVPHEEAQ